MTCPRRDRNSRAAVPLRRRSPSRERRSRAEVRVRGALPTRTVRASARFPRRRRWGYHPSPMILRRGGVLIALLGAVVLGTAASSASGRPAELSKIKVGFLPAEPAVLVTYAKHRGMFTKQGIDAEMVPRTDPAVIIGGAFVRGCAVQRHTRRCGRPPQVEGCSDQGRRRGGAVRAEEPDVRARLRQGKIHQEAPRPRRQDDPDRRPQHDRGDRGPGVAEEGRRLEGTM